MKLPAINIDQTNIILMLLSCGLAYVLPFELVLMSYAFLGPAHYLTQISWLHDKTYFTGVKWLWLPLGLLVVACVVLLQQKAIYYTLLTGTVAIAAGFALGKNWKMRGAIMAVVMLFALILRGAFPPMQAAFLMLVPSVIHIYVFTGLFILLGALKGQSKWGMASFAVFIGCAAIFFVVTPWNYMLFPNYALENLPIFNPLANYLADILSFGGWVNADAMMGFLSFAYTYHYLNWFSKTEVIKWHLIPKRRWAVIIALYVASIGIYLWDYRAGFTALLFLSLLHVVLEFPLNILSVKMIWQSLRQRKSLQPA